jgi:hypothetical protein
MQYRFHNLIDLVALVILCGTATAEVPEWEERFIKTIEQLEGDYSPEALEKLGSIVGMLSVENQPHLRESPAFKLARERLLEFPGFAEHFRQKILAASAWENGESTVQSRENRGFLFQTLSQLPHPETIRVLGELLQDDRDPSKGEVTDTRYVTNSLNAAYSLHGIGLKKPPVGGRYGNAREDLPTWRLWFEQVQHGKSFSFVGDPKTYTLAEKSQANTTRQERRPRSKKGDSADDADDRSAKPELLGILALLLLAVTIAASKLRRKPTKS